MSRIYIAALDVQVLPAFSTSCLGFEPASPVAYLCIPMAGTTKRLRRKTTVSQKGCSELMLLTFEWWMQFLLPVGRYMTAEVWRCDYNGAWIRVWRLLSKEWRKVWDQGFRIKLYVHEACASDLWHAGLWYDDFEFSRDNCNEVVYLRSVLMREGRICIVTMPWKTLEGLRPILSRIAFADRVLRPFMFPSVCAQSFAQTACCSQSEL